MHPEGRFRPASSEIVHDVIDEQIVVVRLDTGDYYSLEGVAALVWTWLGLGVTLTQMRESLGQRFPGEDTESSVGAFVAQLKAEGLIVSDDSAARPGPEEVAGILACAVLPRTFVAPRLEKYTDMQELLLIDPIHETDERGWPHPGPDRAPG